MLINGLITTSGKVSSPMSYFSDFLAELTDSHSVSSGLNTYMTLFGTDMIKPKASLITRILIDKIKIFSFSKA